MVLKLLKDVQIISALIWAITILVCSFLGMDSNVKMFIITMAGFHVVLMTMTRKKNTCS